ncbi:MAG: hypothetical protein LPK09_14460 [Hymenobacteraceae bacterium]|nr:hypothetical protein [Hymenobacteraceae bacterium]
MEDNTQQTEKEMAGMHKLPDAGNVSEVRSDRSEEEIAKARMKALSIIARVFS